jgi:hypothetical protein
MDADLERLLLSISYEFICTDLWPEIFGGDAPRRHTTRFRNETERQTGTLLTGKFPRKTDARVIFLSEIFLSGWFRTANV